MDAKQFLKEKGISNSDFMDSGVADLIETLLTEYHTLQLQQTGVNKSVLLTESDLVDLGFEIVRWKEPNYNIGIDRFYKLDYAIMRINKDTGISDSLVIRFRERKFVLDGYYSVRFFEIKDIKDLISSLTRASQTVC